MPCPLHPGRRRVKRAHRACSSAHPPRPPRRRRKGHDSPQSPSNAASPALAVTASPRRSCAPPACQRCATSAPPQGTSHTSAEMELTVKCSSGLNAPWFTRPASYSSINALCLRPDDKWTAGTAVSDSASRTDVNTSLNAPCACRPEVLRLAHTHVLPLRATAHQHVAPRQRRCKADAVSVSAGNNTSCLAACAAHRARLCLVRPLLRWRRRDRAAAGARRPQSWKRVS